MPEPRKNPDELGALWLKTSDKGPYMTGTIGAEKVVCFPNNNKTKDTQPDWRVLRSKPRKPSNHPGEAEPWVKRTDPGDYPDPDEGLDGL